MFTSSDQDNAKKELDCYAYLLVNAVEQIALGNFGKASKLHQDITNSLNELQRMRDKKIMFDEANEIFNGMKHQEIRRNSIEAFFK